MYKSLEIKTFISFIKVNQNNLKASYRFADVQIQKN